MSDLPTPITRKEQYLNSIARGNASDNLPTPITREEEYLNAIANSGGGGSGGTTNYNALDNKPQIAGTTLQGDKSLADLGIAGEDAIDDVYAVMGEMGAKNLIPYPYYRASGYENRSVTYTVNSNGIITANGTATGGNSYFELRNNAYEQFYLKPNTRYIISGCPSGGDASKYMLVVTYKVEGGSSTTLATDYGSGIEFTTPSQSNANYTIAIKIASGTVVTNLDFSPMLRLASDTDDTYQPYAKTNKQLTDEIANKVDKVAGKGLSTNDYSDEEKGKVADNTSAIEAIVNEYGACNLCPVTAQSETKYGVTFTVNADSSITVVTDANGCTRNTDLLISNPNLPKGSIFKFTDGISTYPNQFDTYYAQNVGGTWTTYAHNEEFTVGDYSVDTCVIRVMQGALFTTPVTVYPMLYDARLNPTGFVPYAMTNRELTDAVNRGSVSVTADGVKTYKELLNQLSLSIDRSKLSIYTMLQVGNTHCNFLLNNYMGVFYTASDFNGVGGVTLYRYILHNNDSAFAMNENGTYSDLSATAPASGTVFTVYY